MDIRQQIHKTECLLAVAVIRKNWEAAHRFLFVLYMLKLDLIQEQTKIIESLKRSA